jgi:hypothetical protein
LFGDIGEEAPCEAPCSEMGGEGCVGGGLGEVIEVSEEGPIDDIVVEDEGGDADFAEKAEGVSGDVQDAVAELVEKAEAAEEVAAAVEEAVSKVEEAVAEVKEAVGGCEECAEGLEDAAGDEDVAEIEVDIETPEEDAEEGDKTPDAEEDDGEIVIESDEAEMEKSASSEEFCKFAKLTPKNRKKVADYWVRMLGYPRDYVNLLVKDYE